MPKLAAIAVAVYFLLAFGLRSAVQYRRTGRTGFVGISGSAGSAEWTGGVLFAVALVCGAAAPLAEMTAWVRAWPPLSTPVVRAVGLVLYALGVAGTLWAQFAMGESWRIGVDPGERTRMVAAGPFRWVRNPIFTSMIVATAGVALLVPNLLSLVAVVSLVTGLEVQVRLVEEPHLLRAHGDAYARYAARTGRFVPGLGTLRGTPPRAGEAVSGA